MNCRMGIAFVAVAFVLFGEGPEGMVNAAPANAKITNLPGLQFQYPHNQYSGYLNAGDGNHFHYWFLESQNKPKTDPLVLWLTGGPGCSSMLALLTENGPFRLDSAGRKVYENVYAWNKVVNYLYIESPGGVGFSYVDNGNTNTSDNATMLHNYNALMDFFRQYPEYNNRDFYITGESYGGYYVPQLGAHVAQQQKAGNFSGNFKGITVGNGLLSSPMNDLTYIIFLYQHGVLGDELAKKMSIQYTDIRNACGFNQTWSCQSLTTYSNINPYPLYQNAKCSNLLQNVWSRARIRCSTGENECETFRPGCQKWSVRSVLGRGETQTYGNQVMKGMDFYNLYFSCYEPSTFLLTTGETVRLASPYTDASVRRNYARHMSHLVELDTVSSHCRGPFQDTATPNYLNQPSVRAALHIPSNLTAKWETCKFENDCIYIFALLPYVLYQVKRDPVNNNYQRNWRDMSWQINTILGLNKRILIYNGDVDSACNFYGDQCFIKSLGLKMTKPWTKWTYAKDKPFSVAGFEERYENLDFITVRGSGHFVPTTKPREAMQMFINFLNSKDYSTPVKQSVAPAPLISPTGSAPTMKSSSTFYLAVLFSLLCLI